MSAILLNAFILSRLFASVEDAEAAGYLASRNCLEAINRGKLNLSGEFDDTASEGYDTRGKTKSSIQAGITTGAIFTCFSEEFCYSKE